MKRLLMAMVILASLGGCASAPRPIAPTVLDPEPELQAQLRIVRAIDRVYESRAAVRCPLTLDEDIERYYANPRDVCGGEARQLQRLGRELAHRIELAEQLAAYEAAYREQHGAAYAAHEQYRADMAEWLADRVPGSVRTSVTVGWALGYPVFASTVTSQ